MIDRSGRITAERVVDGLRLDHARTHERDAEAKGATYHRWRISENRRASAAAQASEMRFLIRLASASSANGLVMTCMPWSRCPLPTTAFSA